MIKHLSLITLLGIAFAGYASAAVPLVVNQTYNSGYDQSNNPLPGGSSDLYFVLQPTAATFPAVVVSQDDPAWVQVAGAKWIGVSADQSGAPGSGTPPALYDYQALLATDFLTPTTVTMSLSFAADDGSVLYVNDAEVTSVSPEGYTTLTPFTYTFTLNSGSTFTPIDFVVNNLNTGGANPSGLLVSGLKFKTNTAPEPSTWALLFAGFGAVLVVRRLRTSSVL